MSHNECSRTATDDRGFPAARGPYGNPRCPAAAVSASFSAAQAPRAPDKPFSEATNALAQPSDASATAPVGAERAGSLSIMWLPGPPEREGQARDALSDVFDHWLNSGAAYLMIEGGWPLDPPASSSEAWSTILYSLADAATAIGRYSHLARTIAPADEQELQALAQEASNRIARLAAAVLIELDQPIDRDAVLTEAAAYLQEVDHEDDGVQHASGALGSLLQAKLVCLEERVALPGAERDQAAVGILSPLVAQAACLRWP